jgi:hypothetical protein
VHFLPLFALSVEAVGRRKAKATREEEQKVKDKQERDMRQREKEKKRADALRLLEIWSEGENLLKKPTDFICKMKFFNTLPDIPSEPKLLNISLPMETFAEYKTTSLQRDFKHDLIVRNDLSLGIDMIDPDMYLLPKNPGRLAKEDEALLHAEKETVAKSAAAGGKRKQPLQVPWLRKSEFITAVFDENLYNQSQKKGASGLEKNREKELQDILKRNTAAVLESFRAANSGVLPVHPRNKELKAVLVQPILPCHDYVAHNVHHVVVEEKEGEELTEAELAERRNAVYFTFSAEDREALVRAVRKRERPESDKGKEEEDEVDELFAEPPKADGGEGALFETAGVFAPRVVLGQGPETKFVFVVDDNSPTVGYFVLERRVEMHDWYLDNRGTAFSVPKKHRIASRPEMEMDRTTGEANWQQRFGEEEYEDEGAGEGEEADEQAKLDVAKELASRSAEK